MNVIRPPKIRRQCSHHIVKTTTRLPPCPTPQARPAPVSQPEKLEAKQATPPFAHRINNQRTQKQPDSNPNRHLDHTIPDVEHHTIDIRVRTRRIPDRRRPRPRRVTRHPRPVDNGRLIRDLIRARDTADQTPTGRQARGHLHENGGQQRRGRETVTQAGVEVAQHADGEGAEGVGDLGVADEAAGREVVDDEAGEGDDEHDGGLFPFALVDDDEAEGEGRDEEEGVVGGHGVTADDFGGSGAVEAAVDGSADCDAETEEEGVDDCVYHADGAGDDVAGLELEGTAD